MNSRKTKFLSFSLTNDNHENIVNELVNKILIKEKSTLNCINPHSYTVSKTNLTFRNALLNSNYLIPDGVGVTVASKFIFRNKVVRVTGYDIFKSLLEQSAEHKFKFFFLGSTPQTLNKIQKKFTQENENLIYAGHYSPPFSESFSDSEIKKMVDRIKIAKPDVVMVGLTAPKQEVLSAELIKLTDASLYCSIGAVFDFYAENVKPANKYIKNFGLEWLLRLIQEPKRLWKRTLISMPIFIVDVLKFKFGAKN